MPTFGIDIETLQTSLQQASLAGIGVSFLTGLVFSFNPVSFASIPVVLAYVTKAHTQRRAVLLGGAFVMGMLATHAVLGVAAALVVTLTASAAIGSVPFGLSLLLAFALGRSIPILLGAWSIGWLESLKGLQRSQKVFETVAGVTLILTGLYLVSDFVINHH